MAGGYIGGVSNIDRGTQYYTKQEANETFYKIGDDTGIIHTQRFIGSSTQRQYELTRYPETKNNTQVFINGAYQNKETYNITSNILTFNHYPIDGQEIEVIIIASTVHNDQDNSAHNLEYDPVGNGVTVLSIEDKLRSITGFVDYVIQDSLICNMETVTGIHDSVLFVSGFWEHADNGGGMFFWDAMYPKNSHNGGTVIDPLKCSALTSGEIEESYFTPNTSGYGCWRRVYRGNHDIKWFGAKGDGNDDTFAFKHALKHNNYVLNVSEGEYIIDGMVINHSKKIQINNNATIKLKDNSNKVLFTISSDDSDIDKFELEGGTLNGNKIRQGNERDCVVSNAKVTNISNCNIKNSGKFGVVAFDIVNINNVTIKDSQSGVSIMPNRTDFYEQISVTNCDIECDKFAIEILKSNDNIPRYNSVLIENNRIFSSNLDESISVVTCKSGLRFSNNSVNGGNNSLFKDGDGGIIIGNIFVNQKVSVQIENFSTLNVSDNHFKGGTESIDAIVHTSSSNTYNNVYLNNHIENYTNSVGKFIDENNDLTFSGNTCHDAPLIIGNNCSFLVSNNKFLGSDVAIEIQGSSCTAQNGNIAGNRFSNNNVSIRLMSSPGMIIYNTTIVDNIFINNSGACILHNKNLGSIDDISVINNTFTNYITLLDVPTSGDMPNSMLWKNNKGDNITLNGTSDLQHGKIIFGEKFTLNDINNMEIPIGENSRAIGQQLKINFNGTGETVSVMVANHARQNSRYTFNPNFRYLVLEWSGQQWDDITHRVATVDYPGIIEVATYDECVEGTNETNSVTPSGLKAILNDNIMDPDYTWSSEKIEDFTTTSIQEAIADIPDASIGVRGLIKIASFNEAREGTNSNKAVTPSGLRGLLHDEEESSNLTTWSSEKIGVELDEHAGIKLTERSGVESGVEEEECPVLFTSEEVCDKILEALISPPQLFYMPARGSLNAVSFNSLSDERFKKNIETINDPLDIINKLRGVKFDWKHTNDTSYGVIAQELEKVLPDLVYTSADSGVKNVNYDGIIGFLIEAVKMLSEK